jgi:hypothetical protein
MSLVKQIVPSQKKGSKTGATARRKCSSARKAAKLFNNARINLLHINDWHALCGNTGAEFLLTDAEGNSVRSTTPMVGNLIRIKLPAPPNAVGEGFDWVRIEKIEHSTNPKTDEELYGFRVRPVSKPDISRNKTDGSAHFYTSDATSTFLVYRKSTIVYAMERGRNEVPNSSGSFLNALRNVFIAIPAMLGFSKPQWQRLVNGILGI